MLLALVDHGHQGVPLTSDERLVGLVHVWSQAPEKAHRSRSVPPFGSQRVVITLFSGRADQFPQTATSTVQAGAYGSDGYVEHLGHLPVVEVFPGDEQEHVPFADRQPFQRSGHLRPAGLGVDAVVRPLAVVLEPVLGVEAARRTEIAGLAAPFLVQEMLGDPESQGRQSGRSS